MHASTEAKRRGARVKRRDGQACGWAAPCSAEGLGEAGGGAPAHPHQTCNVPLGARRVSICGSPACASPAGVKRTSGARGPGSRCSKAAPWLLPASHLPGRTCEAEAVWPSAAVSCLSTHAYGGLGRSSCAYAWAASESGGGVWPRRRGAAAAGQGLPSSAPSCARAPA